MIVAPDLVAIEGIAHGFFTRQGGVSRGIYDSFNIGLGSRDDHDAVLANRVRAARRIGVGDDRLVLPHQHHSADAVVVEAPWPDGVPQKADAVVTARPGLAVAVATADCGPVLFADPAAGVVAAAHAGWRGALEGILEATIETMERLGAVRGRIIAVLGPTISSAAYEVGPEFVDRFLKVDTANRRYFTPSDKQDHARFDLPAYIVDRLRAGGVAKAIDLGLCTYGDESRFFSYRRATHRGEPHYGPLLSAIALAGEG